MTLYLDVLMVIMARSSTMNVSTHSNYVFKFPVFSLSKRKLFPVICDYYIHRTDLAAPPKN